MSLSRFDSPGHPPFGAATAAYQIEGSAFGGCGPCHWDTFAATPGNVARAETGATACDHYHRWEADLDLMQAANLDAYRFSTSWARVMPDGRRQTPRALISTTVWWTACWRAGCGRSRRCIIGNCLRRWPIGAAGPTATPRPALRLRRGDHPAAGRPRRQHRHHQRAVVRWPGCRISRGFMPPACAISARRHGRCTMSCWRTGWRWTACAGWVRATLASS